MVHAAGAAGPDAAGCDVVLVEPSRRRQSGGRIARLADPTAVLLAQAWAPRSRREAGILEVGDIYVVNKADREGPTDRTRLRHKLTSGREAQAGRLATARREGRREPGEASTRPWEAWRSTGQG
jgi:putative protein kinase ArgK-like GTPase of G3E family